MCKFISIEAVAKVLDTSPHKHCSKIEREQLRDIGKQRFAQICFFLEVKELSKSKQAAKHLLSMKGKSAQNKMHAINDTP